MRGSTTSSPREAGRRSEVGGRSEHSPTSDLRPPTRVRTILTTGVLALALAALPAGAAAQGAAPFKLVVNASNPVASISKEQAAKLFYKKQRAWPSGEVVVPVDLAEQVAARKAFSTRVLGKDAGSMKGYWQQMIFTGKGVPPIEKATEAEALAFVAATPGAVGYVAAGTPLPAGVKSVAYQE